MVKWWCRFRGVVSMNELSIIFNKMGIDTKAVLEVAGTKWNFLRFEPGLVGGHCIGVDPYYLAYKAREVGYIPRLILAGRSINEEIPRFIAEETVKLLVKSGKEVKKAKVLILGFSFKENVSDVRNTKVADLVKELQEFGVEVDVYDPWADKEEVKREYGIDLIENGKLKMENYDGVVLAVAHKEFRELESKIKEIKSKNNNLVVYDIKGFFDKNLIDGRL